MAKSQTHVGIGTQAKALAAKLGLKLEDDELVNLQQKVADLEEQIAELREENEDLQMSVDAVLLEMEEHEGELQAHLDTILAQKGASPEESLRPVQSSSWTSRKGG